MISTAKELRQAFLEFYRTHPKFPHPVVESAPIVPPDDPTLLFTSAGMVQFKGLYSGEVDPLPYVRAASVQKCLRAGGKGSDLENVGKTLRHHTFFEMLGNFSFGDYFKKETIGFSWEFCTSKKYMGLNPERIFPTIYGPTPDKVDKEAADFYRTETDTVNPLIPLDEKENYWGPAGDTGACGPCSELVYFMGSDEELAEVRRIAMSGEEGLRQIAERIVEEGDLFLEIWNMVFPQFDQQRDGSRILLKNKGIDTGAGLERMMVALTRERTNKPTTPYETDLMWPIVTEAARILGVPYVKIAEGGDEAAVRNRLAINAIADHTRALVFCLAEGLTPGNVGRRYVIRRIQRRALRFASLLGRDTPFMADLYDSVVEAMGDAYPEIKKNPDFIKKSLRIEEETFLRTRDRGMKLLAELMDQAKNRGDNTIPGPDAFKLWDTYGFPFDMTLEIAEDDGVKVDREGYSTAMKAHQDEARKSWKGAKMDMETDILDELAEGHGQTEFVGYSVTSPVETEVLAFIHKGSISTTMEEGEEGMVVLSETPFYAESGGQVGDSGIIKEGDNVFRVTDTQRTPHGIYVHHGKMESGTFHAGVAATACIDKKRRERIRRNHSVVHLLQAILKERIGDHITQAGSYVGPDYSRFDFTHTEGLTREELMSIQRELNALIIADTPVRTDVLPIEEAKKKGAIAVFGEKYGAVVRVVEMGGGASIEFCGGTHVSSTGQIAHCRIVSEASIASGVRRIEMVTGFGALEQELEEQYHIVSPLQGMMATKGTEVLDRVEALQARVKELEKELAKARQEAALANVDKALETAIDLDGKGSLVVLRLDGVGGNELRSVATTLRDKLGANGIAVAVAVADGKVALVVASGADVAKAYPAGKVVNAIAGELGGKGGGKPDLAQAGAKDNGNVDDVLARVKDLIG